MQDTVQTRHFLFHVGSIIFRACMPRMQAYTDFFLRRCPYFVFPQSVFEFRCKIKELIKQHSIQKGHPATVQLLDERIQMKILSQSVRRGNELGCHWIGQDQESFVNFRHIRSPRKPSGFQHSLGGQECGIQPLSLHYCFEKDGLVRPVVHARRNLNRDAFGKIGGQGVIFRNPVMSLQNSVADGGMIDPSGGPVAQIAVVDQQGAVGDNGL